MQTVTYIARLPFLNSYESNKVTHNMNRMKDREIYTDSFSGVQLHQHNYYLSISIPMVKMTESVCDWYTYILISQCFSDYESGVPVQLWECLGQFPEE